MLPRSEDGAFRAQFPPALELYQASQNWELRVNFGCHSLNTPELLKAVLRVWGFRV